MKYHVTEGITSVIFVLIIQRMFLEMNKVITIAFN